MKVFSKLPNEILDIILQEYWINYFRINVIKEFNNIISTYYEIDEYLNSINLRIIFNKLDNDDKMSLIYINNFLSDKSSYLILKFKFNFSKCNNSYYPFYIQNISDICLKKSSYMRFHTYYTLSTLTFPIF